MNLPQIWSELEADWKASSGFCSRRVPEPTACALYVGVEKPANSRALLAVGKVSPHFRLPESRGLVVRAVEPSVGGRDTVTLAVVLRDRTFADVFDVIVDDIVRRIGTCTSEAEAMEAVVERVLLWQLFLEKQEDRGLSREGQLGLYGELWFLREHLAPWIGWRRAVGSWTGPAGTNQDFQASRVAFEVKTSSAKQHQRLLISSERQLDTTGLDHLILVHLSVDARQGSGETLPAIVADIRRLAGGHSLALANLTDRLLQAGYADEMAPRYQHTGYTEREHHLMRVTGDFPRITETELRKGVGDVHYSISVSECLHHLVTVDAARELLERAVNAS
jgi:hypothetical protein